LILSIRENSRSEAIATLIGGLFVRLSDKSAGWESHPIKLDCA
jgi:hypothetical protein